MRSAGLGTPTSRMRAMTIRSASGWPMSRCSRTASTS